MYVKRKVIRRIDFEFDTKCLSCGTTFKATEKCCPNCGTPISSKNEMILPDQIKPLSNQDKIDKGLSDTNGNNIPAKICDHCGSKFTGNSKSCPFCGNRVDSEDKAFKDSTSKLQKDLDKRISENRDYIPKGQGDIVYRYPINPPVEKRDKEVFNPPKLDIDFGQLSIALLIVGILTLVTTLFYSGCKTVIEYECITKLEWKTIQNVEEWTELRGSSWIDQVPSDATVYRTETRIRSTDKIPKKVKVNKSAMFPFTLLQVIIDNGNGSGSLYYEDEEDVWIDDDDDYYDYGSSSSSSSSSYSSSGSSYSSSSSSSSYSFDDDDEDDDYVIEYDIIEHRDTYAYYTYWDWIVVDQLTNTGIDKNPFPNKNYSLKKDQRFASNFSTYYTVWSHNITTATDIKYNTNATDYKSLSIGDTLVVETCKFGYIYGRYKK